MLQAVFFALYWAMNKFFKEIWISVLLKLHCRWKHLHANMAIPYEWKSWPSPKCIGRQNNTLNLLHLVLTQMWLCSGLKSSWNHTLKSMVVSSLCFMHPTGPSSWFTMRACSWPNLNKTQFAFWVTCFVNSTLDWPGVQWTDTNFFGVVGQNYMLWLKFLWCVER